MDRPRVVWEGTFKKYFLHYKLKDILDFLALLFCNVLRLPCLDAY